MPMLVAASGGCNCFDAARWRRAFAGRSQSICRGSGIRRSMLLLWDVEQAFSMAGSASARPFGRNKNSRRWMRETRRTRT